MSPNLTCQPVRISTGSEDENGTLIFVEGSLVAVAVRLDDAVHQDMRGRYFLEAGFGHCAVTPGPVFASPDDLTAWVLERGDKHVRRSA